MPRASSGGRGPRKVSASRRFEGPLRRLASIVTGRRSKWVILAVWLVAVFAVFPLGSKLSDQTTDSTESFLHASAQDKEALLQKLFSTDRFRAVERWLAARRLSAEKEVAAKTGDLSVLVAQVTILAAGVH